MKSYLGDGAYLEILDQWSIILTTENGVETTNRVVLDLEMVGALTKAVDNWVGQQLQEQSRKEAE